jgi:peroxiredoxin
MKMPLGPKGFQDINWNIPDAVQSLVPGYEALALALMRQTVHKSGVATVKELRAIYAWKPKSGLSAVR